MPYDMQTYQQEIALRLSRYQISLELDPGTLEMMINRARRDVQMATLNVFPERYSAVLKLDAVSGNTSTEIVEYRTTVTRFSSTVVNKVYEIKLPDDFIQMEAVLVLSSGTNWEAREITKPELYGALGNQNTMPTQREPTYTVEKSPDNSYYTILVSAGTSALVPADITIYYLKALKYLERVNGSNVPDVEKSMSYEFEEFVIYQTMLQALKKTAFNSAKQAIASDLEQGFTVLEMNYNATVDRSGLLLPGREGLYPNQPVAQVPNNSIMPDPRDMGSNVISG